MFIGNPFEPYKAVSSAPFVPMVGDEDFPYVPPFLELGLEILFCSVFREPREVERCAIIFLPPIFMVIPLSLSKPSVDVIRFGVLSRSLPLSLFASPSDHGGPLTLPLSLSIALSSFYPTS